MNSKAQVHASHNGHVEVLHLLLESGADTNSADQDAGFQGQKGLKPGLMGFRGFWGLKFRVLMAPF